MRISGRKRDFRRNVPSLLFTKKTLNYFFVDFIQRELAPFEREIMAL